MYAWELETRVREQAGRIEMGEHHVTAGQKKCSVPTPHPLAPPNAKPLYMPVTLSIYAGVSVVLLLPTQQCC